MIGMLSQVYGGCAAFTYFFFDCIASHKSADHLFVRHAREANRNQEYRIGYQFFMSISAKYCFGLVFVGMVAISSCSSGPSRVNPQPNPRVLPPTGSPVP